MEERINSINQDPRTKLCRCCGLLLDISMFSPRPERGLNAYRPNCKPCCVAASVKYKQDNPEIAKAQNKRSHNKNKETRNAANRAYRKRNLEKYLSYKREYVKRPEVKIIHNARVRVAKTIKMAQCGKDKTIKLLGCSSAFLKRHIQNQFKKGMSWDNYGSNWQIDHIIPLKSGVWNMNNSQERLAAYGWRNLQPLSSYENQSKRSELPSDWVIRKKWLILMANAA